MEINIVIGFFIFVLYTLACIADGPDVKPIWKQWLGGKLESYANKLKPICYCIPSNCVLAKKAMNVPQIRFVSEVIEVNILLDESEMYHATIYEEECRKHSTFAPRSLSRKYKIEEGKKKCFDSIARRLQPYIDFKLDEDSYYPGVVVSGRLIVGKKEKH